MITADEAIDKLKQGNQRFVSGVRCIDTLVGQMWRDHHIDGQEPFAIVLGCSDSRVPAEIVFDQGLGDLFVIRVAGNVVAPSQVGSIEFAVERFGTPLVVVMGHSQCGAVIATLEEINNPTGNYSSSVLSIVNRIRPTIEHLVETDCCGSDEGRLEVAIRTNIRASVNQLRHGSQFLESKIGEGALRIIGAEYSLESGEVEFYEG